MEKTTRKSEFGATSRSLPISLLRAREKVMGPIRAMLTDAGVTEQQWRVLRVLAEFGALDGSQIAAHSCLLQPSLTRIMRTLTDKGMVLRSADPNDKRRQMVLITPLGEAVLRDNQAQAKQIADELETKFGSKRMAMLLDLLAEMNQLELQSER